MAETRFFLGVCMALLVGLAACNAKPAADNSGPAETPPGLDVMPTPVAGVDGQVITPKIQGQAFLLKVGYTFSVQIPTIPTQGFTWLPENLDTAILSQLGDPVFKADSAAAGSGGIVTINFKVVGPGTTALTLIYTQPAVNGTPSLYTNSFGVTIEAK